MSRVGRVVAAADRPEMADAAVEVEHGSGVGLERAGQESGQVELVDAEVDRLVQLDGAGGVVDVHEPEKVPLAIEAPRQSQSGRFLFNHSEPITKNRTSQEEPKELSNVQHKIYHFNGRFTQKR